METYIHMHLFLGLICITKRGTDQVQKFLLNEQINHSGRKIWDKLCKSRLRGQELNLPYRLMRPVRSRS